MIKKFLVSVLCLLSLSASSDIADPQQLYLILTTSTQRVVKDYAKEFDYARPPGIQAALLAEDLDWIPNDLNEKQIAALVYISLHLTKKNAIIESEKEHEFKYLVQIQIFLEKIDSVMKKWGEKCRGINEKKLARVRP